MLKFTSQASFITFKVKENYCLASLYNEKTSLGISSKQDNETA